jgi:hypothetical protein
MEVDTNSYMGGGRYNKLNLSRVNPQSSPHQLKMATFTFVDLAGSEKIDDENDLDRINEAKYINKSLSALGNVIYTLKNQQNMISKKSQNSTLNSNKSGGSKSQKQGMHVPYRDSKLTHILKSCFNHGDSMTHLIVCLSPCMSSL